MTILVPQPARSPTRFATGAVALVCIVLSACSSPSVKRVQPTSAPPPAALRVTSSIRDGAHLTGAVAWTAKVTPDTGISAVDFLVDLRVRWTEKNSPYFFNDDHNLLATWLLGAGAHTLTIKASASEGVPATSTAHVIVGNAPTAPAGLVGDYTRQLTQADITRTASLPGRDPSSLPPPGVWTIHARANGLISFDDPQGSGTNEAFTATAAGGLTLYGAANWLETAARRGGFCQPEPVDHSRWSVSGRSLTISGAGHCADREAVFLGTWTRS